MLRRNMQSSFSTIQTVSCLVKEYFRNFLWQLFPVTYLTYFIVSKICHVFCCYFAQVVFKNSRSGKHFCDIKKKVWQQSINQYVNSYSLMLMVLSARKIFTKLINLLTEKFKILLKLLAAEGLLKLRGFSGEEQALCRASETV